jgi:hypothetical protein
MNVRPLPCCSRSFLSSTSLCVPTQPVEDENLIVVIQFTFNLKLPINLSNSTTCHNRAIIVLANLHNILKFITKVSFLIKLSLTKFPFYSFFSCFLCKLPQVFFQFSNWIWTLWQRFYIIDLQLTLNIILYWNRWNKLEKIYK